MYKIAIAGASSLLGKELKDALSDSSLAAGSVTLLDDDQGLGQLDQVGDEITFVQSIDADAFEHVDFTFFCGSEDLTRKHWREALRAVYQCNVWDAICQLAERSLFYVAQENLLLLF